MDCSDNRKAKARIKTIFFFWVIITAQVSSFPLKPCRKNFSQFLLRILRLNIDIIQRTKLSIFGSGRTLRQKTSRRKFESNPFSIYNVGVVNLMKQTKSSVTKKQNFDERDESFLITIFLIFWTIRVLMKGLITIVSKLKPSLPEWGFQLRLCCEKLSQ